MKIWTSTWDAAEGNGIVWYYRREDQPKQRRKTKWACYYWVGPAGHEVWVNERGNLNYKMFWPTDEPWVEWVKLELQWFLCGSIVAFVLPLHIILSSTRGILRPVWRLAANLARKPPFATCFDIATFWSSSDADRERHSDLLIQLLLVVQVCAHCAKPRFFS